MASVIEVEFEGILRRLPYNIEGAENLSFAKLEGRVRDQLKLPRAAQLKVTYKDKEDDDVTLTNDQELEDACVIQKLNPLRLQVVLLPPPETDEIDVLTAETAPVERSSAEEAESVGNQTGLETYVKKLVECYAPVFEGAFPPSQIPEVMDAIVKKVTAQVSAATPTQNVQTTESDNPSPETSLLTPLDWLRTLPPPSVSSEPEKQKTTPAETSPVNSSAESAKEVVHNGVSCDMCNMNPIIGIRYKAIKRMNYDLCGRCFDRSGRADEYNRIERPLSRPFSGRNPVKMVRMSPGIAEGHSYSCTPPNLLAKLVLAGNGGRCKPMKSC